MKRSGKNSAIHQQIWLFAFLTSLFFVLILFCPISHRWSPLKFQSHLKISKFATTPLPLASLFIAIVVHVTEKTTSFGRNFVSLPWDAVVARSWATTCGVIARHDSAKQSGGQLFSVCVYTVTRLNTNNNEQWENNHRLWHTRLSSQQRWCFFSAVWNGNKRNEGQQRWSGLESLNTITTDCVSSLVIV